MQLSHKKDKRQIQSEKAIIEAGIEVLNGNSSASLTEIALAAGVGRATMYRHFVTREALIQAIAKACLQDVEIALEPIADLRGKEAFKAMFELLTPLGDRFHFLSNLWSIAAQDEGLNRTDRQQLNDLKMLIDDAKARSAINRDMPTEWIASFFESTLYAAWNFTQADGISASDAAKLAQQSFLQGCE